MGAPCLWDIELVKWKPVTDRGEQGPSDLMELDDRKRHHNLQRDRSDICTGSMQRGECSAGCSLGAENTTQAVLLRETISGSPLRSYWCTSDPICNYFGASGYILIDVVWQETLAQNEASFTEKCFWEGRIRVRKDHQKQQCDEEMLQCRCACMHAKINQKVTESTDHSRIDIPPCSYSNHAWCLPPRIAEHLPDSPPLVATAGCRLLKQMQLDPKGYWGAWLGIQHEARCRERQRSQGTAKGTSAGQPVLLIFQMTSSISVSRPPSSVLQASRGKSAAVRCRL